MNRLDMLKIFSEYEEFSEGDFTPAELEEYLAYRAGAEQPLSPYEWKAGLVRPGFGHGCLQCGLMRSPQPFAAPLSTRPCVFCGPPIGARAGDQR